MKLKNLKVQELNAQELISINGGIKFPNINWKKWKERGEQFLNIIGLVNVADRFMEGWNSHQC